MDRPELTDRPRSTGRGHVARELWWLVLTVVFAVFIATANVETYRGVEGRGSARVWDLWRRLAGELPDVGSSALVPATYLLTIVVFLVGILSALWLSLSTESPQRGGNRTNDPRPVSGDTP
jgi:hypothetical protein